VDRIYENDYDLFEHTLYPDNFSKNVFRERLDVRTTEKQQHSKKFIVISTATKINDNFSAAPAACLLASDNTSEIHTKLLKIRDLYTKNETATNIPNQHISGLSIEDRLPGPGVNFLASSNSMGGNRSKLADFC